MKAFKSELYKGKKIVFDVRPGSHPNYRVGARCPGKTSQYLGLGRNKRLAFSDLKKSADMIDKAGNWR